MPTRAQRARMTPEQKKEIARKDAIYRKTPKGKQVYTIASWRKRGMICDDYVEVYQRYLNSTHCECCQKEYEQNKMDKHMDHCHKTGKFRNVLCRNCNQLRGHIDKDYKLILKLITMC